MQVLVQYGPSNTLLSSAEVSGTGDLYLPADDSYLNIARDRDLVDEVISIAAMQGVIVVNKGKPDGNQDVRRSAWRISSTGAGES